MIGMNEDITPDNQLEFDSTSWLQEQYDIYNGTHRQAWADRCKAEIDRREAS